MARNKTTASKHDWSMFWGGVLVVILGIVLYVFPGASAVNLAVIAGISLLCVGIFEVISYIRARKDGTSSAWTIVSAICSFLLGILFLIHPIMTAVVAVWMLGWFLIAYGILAVIIAVGIRKKDGFAWWLMLINGIVSILCGIMFNAMPGTFIIFLGAFLIIRGVTMIVYGFAAPNNVKYI